MKVYINGQGHMTKMAPMAINSKDLQKSFSPEPETWHEASGKRALQSLNKLNHDPGMTLTYFTARST